MILNRQTTFPQPQVKPKMCSHIISEINWAVEMHLSGHGDGSKFSKMIFWAISLFQEDVSRCKSESKNLDPH